MNRLPEIGDRVRVYHMNRWWWAVVVEPIMDAVFWIDLLDDSGTRADTLLRAVANEGISWRWSEDDREVCSELPAVEPPKE